MFSQEAQGYFGSNSPMGLQRGETSPAEDATLRIESTTWSRDSHELFDYESRHVFCKGFLLRKAARIFRETQEVSVVVEGDELPERNVDYLVSVKAKDGRYYVYPADRSTSPQLQPRKLWLIIRHLKSESYPLSEGDVVKLGRFKLRVKQIVTGQNGDQNVDFKLDDVEVPSCDLSKEEAQHLQCRICLLEGPQEDNPLVRACQCKGSIMYVHLECLQHWVNSRLNLTDDPPRSCCFVRQLLCELCKSPFPSTVLHHGNRLNVVKMPNVQPPFIVLENLVGQPANRGVHLCSMAVKKECKLGRGHESDVRIADVSISRFHATIRFQDGEFWLEDRASKFGTLVALRRATVIERDSRLSVQVGRTVLSFAADSTSASELEADCVAVETNPNGFTPLVQRAPETDQPPFATAQEPQALSEPQAGQPPLGPQQSPGESEEGAEGPTLLRGRLQRRMVADPSLERLCLMDMVNASLLPTNGMQMFQSAPEGHRPTLPAYTSVQPSSVEPSSPHAGASPTADSGRAAPIGVRPDESNGPRVHPGLPAGGSPMSGTLHEGSMEGCIQGLSQAQRVGLARMLDQLNSTGLRDGGMAGRGLAARQQIRGNLAVQPPNMQQQLLFSAIFARLRQGSQPTPALEAGIIEPTVMAESPTPQGRETAGRTLSQRPVSEWHSARSANTHGESTVALEGAEKETSPEAANPASAPHTRQRGQHTMASRNLMEQAQQWPLPGNAENDSRSPVPERNEGDMTDLREQPRPTSSPHGSQDGPLP